MLKNISNINGIQFLNKSVQKDIKGGSLDGDTYGVCLPHAFLCGIPDHICCNDLCVLETHPACNF
ncbi:hypothetical protein [Aquimarina algiphila]|uniref:hypothetical protein n=1 Tax=Aquimarina algiphila TaxID=2047982 RepID=UPI00232ABCBD|nr:hypothetical protein [Aquimarina algiphila]